MIALTHPGLPSPRADARGALLRAAELQPGDAWAWRYLVDLAVANGDTAAVGQYLESLEEVMGDADLDIYYYLWRVALARSDTVTLDALRVGIDDVPYPTLLRLAGVARLDGLGIPDAEVSAATLREKAGREREVTEADMLLRALALNGGRPTEALAIPWPVNGNTWNRFHQVIFGLYWDADPGLTAEAAQWVRDVEPLGAEDGSVNSLRACALGLWELHRGSSEIVGRAVAKLRTIGGSLLRGAHAEVCASLLEAEVSVRDGEPDARGKVETLDQLMRQGVYMYGPITHMANLATARLFDAIGEPERALAAVRRRVRDPVRGVHILSPMIWEEGRLAEKVGDVDGAIAAYRHFVVLQAGAEEAFQPRLEEARQALQRLTASRR